jgi:predicted ATP-dependent serine protease
MSKDRRLVLLKTLLGVVGGTIILASAPCFMFGGLGLAGRVADTSLEENRLAGLMSIGIGLLAAGLGVGLLVVAARLRLPDRRCRNCGYDLRAAHAQCPECGVSVDAVEALDEYMNDCA